MPLHPHVHALIIGHCLVAFEGDFAIYNYICTSLCDVDPLALPYGSGMQSYSFGGDHAQLWRVAKCSLINK
jgi:hypothetical protein